MKSYHAWVALTVAVLVAGAALFYYLQYLHIPAFVGVMRYLGIAISAAVGIAVIYALAKSIALYGRGNPYIDGGPIAKIFALIAAAVLVVFLLGTAGINVTGVLVGAGFLGIVVGIASQATLGNLFAGIMLMVSRPFKKGDMITFSTWQFGIMPPSWQHDYVVPGHYGEIVETGLMYTQVKRQDGVPIYVPNNIIAQALIMGHSHSNNHAVSVKIELPIGKDIDVFRSLFMKNFEGRGAAMTKVARYVKVEPTYIGASSYGVEIRTDHVVPEDVAGIEGRMRKAALKAVGKL